MGFYGVLSAVNNLLSTRHWQLCRCHRRRAETLHYYVTDASNQVLTPTYYHQRAGLTLPELLDWLEHSNDFFLSNEARELRGKIGQVA